MVLSFYLHPGISFNIPYTEGDPSSRSINFLYDHVNGITRLYHIFRLQNPLPVTHFTDMDQPLNTGCYLHKSAEICTSRHRSRGLISLMESLFNGVPGISGDSFDRKAYLHLTRTFILLNSYYLDRD